MLNELQEIHGTVEKRWFEFTLKVNVGFAPRVPVSKKRKPKTELKMLDTYGSIRYT